MTAGAAALSAEGYRFVVPVEPEAGDFDAQGHLNNASTVRLFNDLRMAYVRDEVGEVWIEMLQRDRLVVAARELHVLYESEGRPGEEFVGALRYVRREGKAAVCKWRCSVDSDAVGAMTGAPRRPAGRLTRDRTDA